MTVHLSAAAAGAFGKRPEGLVDLLVEAGAQALEFVGRKPIDLLVVGTMAAGSLGATENVVARVADRLGLDSGGGFRVDAASASGAAAFQAGASLVASSRADRVLVVAGEKMTHLPSNEVARVLAQSLAPSEESAGATMPGLAALVAQHYLSRYDIAPEVLDDVAATFRTNAVRNPKAQFQSVVRPEEVAASRPVALPLRLLHCSAVTDGAAAVVLERGEGPVMLRGMGQGLDALALVDRVDLTSFRATRLAAQRAYEAARVTRKSVQVAEIHDAFAPFALIDMEDLGFCGAGEAASFWGSGAGRSDGVLPMNPSGGLLGRGHPVGASGLAGIVEIARQISGHAETTALPKRPHTGLAQSIGGLGSHNFVTILGGPTAS
jgi:acetyl-CoA C-acetyltransferase